jgi:predicted Rossmann fold nucleotide-binding protein DprA/Smf involved in DNA uptake
MIVQLAALVLVEGALLLGWYMLDNSTRATALQRSLYATLTVTAYGVLWAVAIAHGEGLAGIGFRATLGVLIAYSVIESGLLAGIKLRQQADRDITRHRAVKRHRRKLAIDDAKAADVVHFDIKSAHRDMETAIARRVIELDKQRQLADLTAERANQYKPVRIEDAQKSRTMRQRSSKQAAVDKTLDILKDDPHASIRTIANAIDRAPSTVSNYLRELEQADRIARRNGTSVKVLMD